MTETGLNRFDHVLRLPLFDGVERSNSEALLDNARPLTVLDRSDVLVQGLPAPGAFLVLNGVVEICHLGDTGDRVFIGLAHDGWLLGEVEALADLPCTATCTADPGTQLLLFPTPSLRQMARDPAFLRNLFACTAARMARDNQNRLCTALYTVEQRVCAQLLMLADRSGVISRSQGFLSESVGCSRQSVNKVLSDLRREGLVRISKGVVVLTDRKALGARAS